MLTVEPLTDNNVKKVAEIERECFGDEAWSENLLRAEIGQSDKYYFVISNDGAPVAYGGFVKVFDEGDIMNIAVSSDYRRKGYATKLFDCFFNAAMELNITKFTLEVRESNTAARNLYEKLGFVFSGVRYNYYRNKENCCIYWKVVSEELS